MIYTEVSTEQRTTKRVSSWGTGHGGERLSEPGFFHPKGSPLAFPVAVFNYLMKDWREGEARFFSEVHSENTIGSRVQL